MSHQSKLTSKRSNEEVKLNGRKKTKLKIHIVTIRSGMMNVGASIMIMVMSPKTVK